MKRDSPWVTGSDSGAGQLPYIAQNKSNESARTPSASGAFEATAKFGVELIDVG